jgi:predicted nucleotidyltransferase
VVSRFVDACSADDRVVAAFLRGSHARGEADEYSDLDLCVITRDEAFESVMAERATFVRQLGEPLFMEDFGLDRIAFFILADGTECELVFGREGALEELEVGTAPSSRLRDRTPTSDASSSARSSTGSGMTSRTSWRRSGAGSSGGRTVSSRRFAGTV